MNISKRDFAETSYILLLNFSNSIEERKTTEQNLVDNDNIKYNRAYLITRFKITQFKFVN